jgi:hypothetical protein
MDKINGIILEGEKLGMEKYAGKENRTVVNLHVLNGFETLSLRVKDASLIKQLDEYPNRKIIKVKANVNLFEGKLYITAASLAN